MNASRSHSTSQHHVLNLNSQRKSQTTARINRETEDIATPLYPNYAMTVAKRPNIRTAQPKRIAPGTTLKRLPWLDGKASQAVSATPHEDDPSPSTRPLDRKFSRLSMTKRTATTYRTAKSIVRPPKSVPVVRMNLVSSPVERRMLAAGSPLESSPSPVTRHRMAQDRRGSVARPGFHLSSISHDTQKRLSFADTFDPSVDEEVSHKHRTRADSLAPVPDHLERSSTSDSIDVFIQRNVVTTRAAPVVVSRPQMSPYHPRPSRNAFERVGVRRFSNAIENLEDMVQEAVGIADGTTNDGQVGEIYEIIEDARQAIQEASGGPPRYLMATSSPLPASLSSGSDSGRETFGGSLEDLSPMRPGKTLPALPILTERVIDHPPDLVPPVVEIYLQRGPASVDWAYQRQEGSAKNSSASSSSRNGTSHSRFSTRSDLLLPPDPTQIAAREHVDFVLRPAARDISRGRLHQRNTIDPVLRSRKYSRHRRFRSLSSTERVAMSSPAPRHKRATSLDSSSTDESFDGEEPPPQQYGQDLGVREQAQHTFNLRRHHRRQPIARNWGTGKKRLTAMIACVNTALLGIIIGVYVSHPSSHHMYDL